MKKIKLRTIIILVFVFTLGIVTSGLTISYAATTLSSKNVHYDNTNSGGSSSNVSGAIDELYAAADDKDILKKEIIDTIYPIGSIYITTTDSTVNAVTTRFGGTWVRYSTDTTLVGYKEGTNTINGTGGSKTTTISYTPKGNVSNYSGNSGSTVLTIDQIPAHDHKGMTWYDTQIVGLHSGTATGVYLSYSNGASESTATGLRSGWTGGSQGHTHTINHSHTFTGTKENLNINVQDPYTVVYMYKRTA